MNDKELLNHIKEELKNFQIMRGKIKTKSDYILFLQMLMSLAEYNPVTTSNVYGRSITEHMVSFKNALEVLKEIRKTDTETSKTFDIGRD